MVPERCQCICASSTQQTAQLFASLSAQGSNFSLSFIIHNLLQPFCKFSTSPLMQQWDWDADSFPCVVCGVLGFFLLNTENTGYGFSFYSNFSFQLGDDLSYAECRQATSKDFLLWSMPSPPVKPAKITLEVSTWTHHLEFREEIVPTPPKMVWELNGFRENAVSFSTLH